MSGAVVSPSVSAIRALPSGLDPAPRPQPGDRLLDLRGAILTPGLVDMHVHISRGAVGASQRGDGVAHNLGRQLEGGVTAVRSLGDPPRESAAPEDTAGPSPDAVDRRREHAASREPLPLVVHAGRALAPRQGYGAFLGRGLSQSEDPHRVVAEEVDRGARLIKLILSGPVDFERGEVAPGGLGERFARGLVRAATERGLPVAAHANGSAAVRRAVSLGVRTVEHGILVERPELELLAEADVAWVPTLMPLAHLLGRSAEYPGITAVWTSYLQSIARGRDLGIRLLAGTDGGSPGVPHGSLLRELALLALAGLSAEELLRCATSAPAEELAACAVLPEGYGTLRPGAGSDLVWFGDDPLEWALRAGAGLGLVEAGRGIVRGDAPAARGALLGSGLVWWSDH